jgi:hypothetical protein
VPILYGYGPVLPGAQQLAIVLTRVSNDLTDQYAVLARRSQDLADSFKIVSTQNILRPVADISLGGWIPHYIAGQQYYEDLANGLLRMNLWSHLDEEVADAERVRAGLTAPMEVAMSYIEDPLISSGHKVRVTASTEYGYNMQVSLYQGTTLIKSWNQALTGVDTEYVFSPSAAEIDSITDYKDLRIRITPF